VESLREVAVPFMVSSIAPARVISDVACARASLRDPHTGIELRRPAGRSGTQGRCSDGASVGMSWPFVTRSTHTGDPLRLSGAGSMIAADVPELASPAWLLRWVRFLLRSHRTISRRLVREEACITT
jgi:hypothetical protein